MTGIQKSVGFYDLDEATRARLVDEALTTRSSLMYRWLNLAAEQSDGWSQRALEAAKLVGTANSVIDLGCGMMTLERYLYPSITYIPVDIVRRDHRTHVVDLNREPLPNIEADCLVGLGLLEYIFDVGALIDAMTKYRNLVISYKPIELVPDRAFRRGHAWVNDFGVVEIESLFANQGYAIQSQLQLDGSQYMWSFLQS